MSKIGPGAIFDDCRGRRTAGPARVEDLTAIQSRCPEEFAAPAFYRRLQSRGVEFGAALQGARHFWRRDGEALARIEPSPASLPRTIELALQAFAAALPAAAFTSASEAIFVAASLRHVEILCPGATVAWSHATIDAGDRRAGSFTGAIDLLDESGRVRGTYRAVCRAPRCTACARECRGRFRPV